MVALSVFLPAFISGGALPYCLLDHILFVRVSSRENCVLDHLTALALQLPLLPLSQ
jgi:hypothetical protein